ncbi:MAG: hypothetical protein ACT4NY_06080 [Pseudonocardiales bacterium]
MARGAGQVARNVVLEDLLEWVQWSPEDLAERLNVLAVLDLGTQLHLRPARIMQRAPTS